LGQCSKEGGNCVLPNLQPAPHVCFSNDRSRSVADYDRPVGHSSTQIVRRYAQVLDQNRFDAMKKLESLRQSAILKETESMTAQPEEQASKTLDRTESK
jgi:hypothetical protein